MENLSEKYRLMIYFAHSTITLYNKTIVCHHTMSVSDFREKNLDVVNRVVEEGKNIFGYELSFEQINRAIYCYLQSAYNPQSVYETDAYILK